ncbi:unnamed protein product [Rotaria socialis]|uniref:Rubicon Homology domain-containing protein n=1 Tax=Rotaria socialis TaxID=392032 RepID=A0A820P1S6_9BILA|nr:unnamed protein product [Rotaria socialis]CAF3327259.1 unnamed protein product [Rotaria socialis]CAF3676775.1 unnamed protein product [Rotaria socialis]CAF4399649.1 unnamed protein product [Rotaria socialis]CAF4444465.1 unnamed protein product [Rotaria socialis]
MKAEVLNELDKIWPTLNQVRSQLLSGPLRRLSGLSRRESQRSPSSSLSSSLKTTNSPMQQCWSTCEPDSSIDKSICQRTIEPCEFCFQPSSSVIMTDAFNANSKRLSSEPLSVLDPLTETLVQNQSPSHSSGFDNAFGNELSPDKTTWTLGVNDFSSCTSITSDDIFSDQDRSVFDDHSTHNDTDEQDVDDDSFEVLSFEAPPESSLYIREFPHTTVTGQNNVCDCCSAPLSLVSNEPQRRCHYYGKLYCSRCHTLDYAYIPAKIIQSFDMRLYPVCRRAKSILQSNYYQPIFDIQNDNENLYAVVPLLAEIKAARTQFQNYHAYLSTCTRIEHELNEKFLKEFYARDYLYQSIHLYSLNDLLLLKKIANMLKSASRRARQHIDRCVICRAKGFICEICKKRNDLLYPFYDDKTIGRCNICANTYHRKCWDNIDHDCPKCYRLIQRKHEQDMI